MTKEQLIAAGLSEEQANAVLAMRGNELNGLRAQIQTLTQQNETLQADSDELANLRQSQMTEEEQRNQVINDANAEKEKYMKLQSRLKAEQILIKNGLTEDDYKDFIDGIVTTDEEVTETMATSLATMIKSKTKAAEDSVREELLKGTPRPGAGDGDGKNKTQAEEIAESIANGIANSKSESAKGLNAYVTGGN